MNKIRYRDCSIGDVIEVTGPCTIVVESKSGRSPRLKVITDQGSDVSFSTGEQAHTCCDTKNSLTKGD
ncbi:hypothetical protein ACPESL_06170 [Psychrobacter pocilloporae]|uniref:hypothetical protein n=1 Tax=Psychrobacter pocilloporae TaxID=1775882 RepID=UPI003C2C4DD0